MELILLRHARAEDAIVTLPDLRRALTTKGRKRARAVAIGLGRLLVGNRHTEIWASPALRSLQTASIVADQLGIKEVGEHSAIYSGQLETLSSEWNGLADDTTLIIVGHEPYLSIWSRQLANVSVPFKKCAAAGFTLAPPTYTTGSLSWFAGPKMLVALGSEKDNRG